MSSLHGLLWIQYSEETSRSINIYIYKSYQISQSKPNQKLRTNSIVWVHQMNMSPWIHRVDLQLNQLKPMSTAIMIHFSSTALLYNLYTHIHTLHKPLKHKGLILEPHQYNPAWQMFLSVSGKKIQAVVPSYTFPTATLERIFLGWIALSQRSSNPACWHTLFFGPVSN